MFEVTIDGNTVTVIEDKACVMVETDAAENLIDFIKMQLHHFTEL